MFEHGATSEELYDVEDSMELALWLVLIGFAVMIVGGIVFIRKQSETKGRWGIGSVLGTVCPRCGEDLTMIRKPRSYGEVMWGGWDVPEVRLQGR
jgi:hypothetical protein